MEVISCMFLSFIPGLLPNQALAHSSNIAVFKLFQQKSAWYLTATLAQTTVQAYLNQSIGNQQTDKKLLTTQQEQALTKYLKEKILININGKKNPLQLNYIKGHL